MADLQARVAYVKGLLSGLGTGNDSKEASLLEEVVRVLDEMSEELAVLKGAHEELEEYVQALDEDLYVLETAVFEDEEPEIEGGEVAPEVAPAQEEADGEVTPVPDGEGRRTDIL